MFGNLSEKFNQIFSKLAGHKKFTEENISEAVREVRLALLDADVNYSVVKTFIKKVKEKALGEEVLKSITPGQQFIKLIHDELVSLMGSSEASFSLCGSPSVIMLCGLQGSGKTTHAAKLAYYFKRKEYNKKALLVACDLQRPAAIEQLKILGTQIQVPVFTLEGEKDPVSVAKAALTHAKNNHFDLVILDTAGRLHIDEELMEQLARIKTSTQPHEILFVANGASGQDAVTTASAFNEKLDFTGAILTMLDGDSRGGAAISIREITGKPLKFEGIGEKIEDIQLFNPSSMADRILGMGDTINLVKKVQEHVSEEEARSLEEKMLKATFTYEDYLKQTQAVRKMGALRGLLKMLPGEMAKMAQLQDIDSSEKAFFKMEAIILSMTKRERIGKDDINLPRAKRIAKGSGTTVGEVNKLKKSFDSSKKLFKGGLPRKFLKGQAMKSDMGLPDMGLADFSRGGMGKFMDKFKDI